MSNFDPGTTKSNPSQVWKHDELETVVCSDLFDFIESPTFVHKQSSIKLEVIRGSGHIATTGFDVQVSEGDVVTLDKGTPHKVRGDMSVVATYTPGIKPSQVLVDGKKIPKPSTLSMLREIVTDRVAVLMRFAIMMNLIDDIEKR